MAPLRVPKRLSIPPLWVQVPASGLSLSLSARCGIRPGDVRFGSSVPTIAQASFWKSLVPKPFRSDGSPKTPKVKTKGWNPATFYIVIFLLIGSMSIQMISLRKGFEAFMRQSDVRIGLLREVIEKIQKGESVDVEATLGTGDPEREEQWEQLLRDIEKGDKAQRRQAQGLPAVAPTEPKDIPEPARAKTAETVTSKFY